jgi:hypothetical protein
MKNQIKYLQNMFYDLLNDYSRVLIMVKYSDRTIIGNRGFTIFSPDAMVKFDRWDVSEVKESSEKEKSEEEEKIISLENFRKTKP